MTNYELKNFIQRVYDTFTKKELFKDLSTEQVKIIEDSVDSDNVLMNMMQNKNTDYLLAYDAMLNNVLGTLSTNNNEGEFVAMASELHALINE